MKSIRWLLATLVLLSAAAVAQTAVQKPFEAMKSLVGNWEGKNSQGQALQLSYRLTGGGSALLSEIAEHGGMISMFHMDGNRFLMTHYCGAGNQPRMVGKASADGKTITFEFLDATNLESPKTGHMERLVVTLVDADHHTEDWTFVQDGKGMNEHFDLRRSNATQAKM